MVFVPMACEIYFRILKSGCRVEKLQLETKERFDACLTLYMIIAWRILYLTMLARAYPSASCEIIFTEEEWKVAYMMKQRKKPPKQPITLAMMVNLIGQLGGHLNRKHDNEPGPTVLWLGLQRLRDFIFAQQVYNQIKE